MSLLRNMSSNKQQNQNRSYRSFNPIPDYSSSNCPKRIIFNGELKNHCKVNNKPCNSTHYNICPLYGGQLTLI